MSPGCITPGFSWIQWEPTVWEQPDGTVLMLARNNTHWGLGHGKPTSGQYLLTGIEPEVAYPQMWRHDDTLAVCYTQGNSSARSIRVALVKPLPAPDRYSLFPRGNDSAAGARPERVGNTWSFNREQRLGARQPVDPGDDGFSFGAWLQPRTPGVIVDNRAGEARFCVDGASAVVPFRSA